MVLPDLKSFILKNRPFGWFAQFNVPPPPPQYWRQVYLVTVLAMILAVFFAQIHPLYLSKQWKQLRSLMFCCVAAYGLVPTLHWVCTTGGLSSDLVQVSAWPTAFILATFKSKQHFFSLFSGVCPSNPGDVFHRSVGDYFLRLQSSWTVLPRWELFDPTCKHLFCCCHYFR